MASALTSLYSFLGGEDGSFPASSLIQGADGKLYGTALILLDELGYVPFSKAGAECAPMVSASRTPSRERARLTVIALPCRLKTPAAPEAPRKRGRPKQGEVRPPPPPNAWNSNRRARWPRTWRTCPPVVTWVASAT